MAKGMYYGSYRKPRIMLWSIGVVLFIAMMACAFIGYVLPYGQMSLWGATVITNLFSAIPWVGNQVVQFLWGGFSVDNPTLVRFYALHYLLPFIIAALAVMHLIALHENGSSNPLGVSANYDRVSFHPYYTFKDIVGFFLFFVILAFIVFYYPNAMGHPDNYIPANPMSTPASIVPEFYFLPFYAILRAIPSKLGGVIAMFGAILILFLLPILDTCRIRGAAFRPLLRLAFWLFVGNFLLLLWLGSQHAAEPFVTISKISTVYYFAHFFVILPIIGIVENNLADFRVKPILV